MSNRLFTLNSGVSTSPLISTFPFEAILSRTFFKNLSMAMFLGCNSPKDALRQVVRCRRA